MTDEEVGKAQKALCTFTSLIAFSAAISAGGNEKYQERWAVMMAQWVANILAFIKPLGLPKATALLVEVLNVMQRIGAKTITSPPAGQGLVLAFGTFGNYLKAHGIQWTNAWGVQCPTGPSQSQLMTLSYSASAVDIGATSDDDIEVVIERVSQYLSKLCQ